MYVSIRLDRSGSRKFYNVEGSPEDISQALIDLADSHEGMKEALSIIANKLIGKSGCECGKLSASECEMKCIAPTVYSFENPVSFTPNFPTRTDDQGNDDGAYADDDLSDD